MPAPAVSPEAFRLAPYEIVDLCRYAENKTVGGLVIDGGQAVPATGWDESAGEDGVFILRGSTNCVMLHADSITGVQQMHHDLVLAGSYVALHEQLRTKECVVGVTFEALAGLAVRGAGFSRLHLGPVEPHYEERVRDAYDRMRLSARRELRLAMIYMPTDEFIDTYASKRLGRSAAKLLETMLPFEDNG